MAVKAWTWWEKSEQKLVENYMLLEKTKRETWLKVKTETRVEKFSWKKNTEQF